MKTHFRKLNVLVSGLLFLAMLLGLAMPLNVSAVGTTILVDDLQPDFTSPGGGGVWCSPTMVLTMVIAPDRRG